MADEYRFNTERRKLLGELMQPEYQELFMALTGSYQDIDLSRKRSRDYQKAPHRSQRGAQAGGIDCVSALGKGKLLLGRKESCAWMGLSLGNAYEVTAAGSSSSGPMRPFGLDCSGFIDWVFYNQSGGRYIIGHGGGRLPSTTTAHPSVGTMPSRATSSFILATVMWGSSAASTAAEISSSSTAPAAPIMWW